MKTDRELLELAAKAAGKKYNAWSDKITDYDSPHYGEPALHMDRPGGQCESWNPLIDDGDALRLAVKVGVDIVFAHKGMTRVYAGGYEFTEYCGDDQNAATRRSIVRAAAAIGESM